MMTVSFSSLFSPLLLFASAALLFSCKTMSVPPAAPPPEPAPKAPLVGSWAAMEWRLPTTLKQVGKRKEVPTYELSATGEQLCLTCTNYRHIWLSRCTDRVQQVELLSAPSQGFVTTDFSVTAEGGQLWLSVSANPTPSPRQWEVVVTAGDVFDYFRFVQPPRREP